MTSEHPPRYPDLVMIGAMKSATTSLHAWLATHPHVAASTPKELNFFFEPKYSSLGLGWYGQQFQDPLGAKVAIESSVNYTKAHEHPGVPGRIAALVPQVKMVYVVRDPLARIASHYVHELGAGTTRASFHDWIGDPATSTGVQTSRYWWQLQRFLEHFDAGQFKVVDMATVQREPMAVVTELLEWVGLDPSLVDAAKVGTRVHDSRNKLQPNAIGRLFWSNPVLRRKLRWRLGPLVGKKIQPPVWSDADRARVIDYLAPDVAEFRRFTGQDFAHWPL